MTGFNDHNLRRLGNQVSVPINSDEDGYLGRECHVAECLGYFKITPGTGIKGPTPCHCPYCGHTGDNNTAAKDGAMPTPSIADHDQPRSSRPIPMAANQTESRNL